MPLKLTGIGRNGWRTVSAIAGAAILLFIGAYALRFGPQSGWRLSGLPEDWARFGEYIGGVFGMLAFLGVLITLNLQREQLDDQRRQFPLAELQRMMASASQYVDQILASEPAGVTEDLRQKMLIKGAAMSVFNMLSAIGVATMYPTKHYMIEARSEELRNRGIPIITRDINLAVIELQWLVQCLGAFAEEGGSVTIINLYKDRYKNQVAWMSVLGLLKAPVVEKYFNPKAFIELSRAAHEQHEKKIAPIIDAALRARSSPGQDAPEK